MLASSGVLSWTDFQRNSVVAIASFLRHLGRKQASGPHADVNLDILSRCSDLFYYEYWIS